MYFILYYADGTQSINDGEVPAELPEGTIVREISQNEYFSLSNQFPNLANLPYFVLMQDNRVISFNQAPIPEELPEGVTLREISETEYSQLTQKFSYHYIVDESGNIVVNDDSKIREEKIKEAIDYKEKEAQKINFHIEENSQVVWFSKQRQHELWMEANIKREFLNKNPEGCYGNVDDRIYINEIDNYPHLDQVIDWTEQLSCYTGTVEGVLRTHIGYIKTKDLETVINYDVSKMYPEPLTFNF